MKQLLEIYHQDRLLGKIREVPQCCARKHLEVFDQQDKKIFDISGPGPRSLYYKSVKLTFPKTILRHTNLVIA